MEETKEEIVLAESLPVEIEESQEKKPKKKKAVHNAVYQRLRKQAEQYSQILSIVSEKYREFKLPGAIGEPERIFRVYNPSPKIESSVNMTYTKIYGHLMQDDDCLPEAQIMDLMRKRNLWDDMKDKRMESLQERSVRLRGIIIMSGETMTVAEMDKKAEEFSEIEKELDELNKMRNSFVQNSIEHRAYESKVKDQLWQCVRILDAQGSESLLWKNMEDIDNETDRILLFRVMNECVTFWQGVPSEFLDERRGRQNGESDTQ
jgi:hypothetical protein